MESISILEFRKNVYKYLQRLPIQVVAKKKVVFTVHPPDFEFKKPKEGVVRGRMCPKHGGQMLGGKYQCCEV